MQTLIVCALQLGISKRALMEDYYMDEIRLIFDAYAKRRNPPPEEVQMSPFEFFGASETEVNG